VCFNAGVPASRFRIKVRLTMGVASVAIITVAVVAAAMMLTTPAAPIAAGGPPRYVDETTTAGIDHAYDGDEWTFFVGGGVAVFDCNDDGRPEAYLAGGANAAALYRNDSPIGGALGFNQLADPATDLVAVTGAYPLDVDGDGRVDLAVMRLGENVLLRGLGDCRFERANEAWAFDGGDAWSTAFSAKWEGAAELPTLAVGNYAALTEEGRWDGTCSDNELIRPAPGGAGFDAPIALSPGWCTLSALFSDWDRSGRVDLRLSNDRHYYSDDSEGGEQLWRVAAGEVPRLYTEDDGWASLQINGMGIASQDLTGDGLPEVFLTSMGDNKLQMLSDGSAGPSYRDIALRRGVTAHRPFAGDTKMPSTAWHAEFQDVNNDGYMDLFVAKGNVDAMPDFAAQDPSNLLLGQPDGTFVEAAEAAGILSFARGRGAALVDFNLDGLLDLVEVNRREAARVWRNVGAGDAAEPAPMSSWVALRLEQAGANRNAIGSWIEVSFGDRTIQREVTVGGGHAGGQLGWTHIGLGAASEARLRVHWPDGETGPWLTVGASRFWSIERGATQAQAWLPPSD
jgi:hypothetical protein